MLIFWDVLLCENNECQVRKGFLKWLWNKLLIWANRCRVNNPHESYVNDPLRSSFCQHNIDHSFYYYHNQFIGQKYSNIKIQREFMACVHIYNSVKNLKSSTIECQIILSWATIICTSSMLSNIHIEDIITHLNTSHLENRNVNGATLKSLN